MTFVDALPRADKNRLAEWVLDRYGELLGLGVSDVLQICQVQKSTFYSYKENKGKVDEKEREYKEKIIGYMREIITERHGAVPSYRKMTILLNRKYVGLKIGKKKVTAIMKEAGIRPQRKKKDAYKGQATHDHECSAKANLVCRNFFRGPRQVILTDITYLYYGLSRMVFYLCTFLDAFTLEVLGAAASRRMDVSIVRTAYNRMMEAHGDEIGKVQKNVQVYIHSDQGSVYTSTDFASLLEGGPFIQSMSRRGNSQDNAPQESFFGNFKSYLIDKLVLAKDFEQAKTMVKNAIWFNNREDIRGCLGDLTPFEFFACASLEIYPCDEYFGVPASELHSLEEVLEARKKARPSRRNVVEMRKEMGRKSQAEWEESVALVEDVLKKCPAAIMERDRNRAKEFLKKAEKGLEKADSQLEDAKKLLDDMEKLVKDIEKAISWYASADDDVKEDLKHRESWKKYKELSYINDMTGMF